MAREPDFETQRRHALDDRRGTIIREGISWIDGKETHWQVRHALWPARVDQFDLVANGVVVRTCGLRRLPLRFRPPHDRATFGVASHAPSAHQPVITI